jgi:hypothetical protein
MRRRRISSLLQLELRDYGAKNRSAAVNPDSTSPNRFRIFDARYYERTIQFTKFLDKVNLAKILLVLGYMRNVYYLE